MEWPLSVHLPLIKWMLVVSDLRVTAESKFLCLARDVFQACYSISYTFNIDFNFRTEEKHLLQW